MESFNKLELLVIRHFKISLFFLFLGMFFGLIYSLNLLGLSLVSETLEPYNMRSLHISLMLYGFIPLMLSYLPFLLINKDNIQNSSGLHYLNLYTLSWYIFLAFMISSLLFGNTRGLAFYDFPYELNFILALSGIFYIFSLFHYIKTYEIIPLWIKVCLGVALVAPFVLLILMHPIIGQVESTISGPHGDNTLGMSLGLIPIYYLIIKLLSIKPFHARWNILWIIPVGFYFISVLYRIIIGALSYELEWFLQWLSLLFIPLLYRWFQDAKIYKTSKMPLLFSIIAFLFVDIQGNILFIPSIRWLFHRNDLIVAHSHVAMGIGIFFMAIAMFSPLLKELKISFYRHYLLGILGIFFVLSISGFIQADIFSGDILILWTLRFFFGLVTFFSFIHFIKFKIPSSRLQRYNLLGLFLDGIGGLILLLVGNFLYKNLGFYFAGNYEYVVFAFVSCTGIIHLFALIYEKHTLILTKLTLIIRVVVSSVFFALYLNSHLGIEALLIASFDLLFVFVYLLFISSKDFLCFE